MPMRNAEPYVREAVSSVLSQGGDEIELVVVDDGSSDTSRATVESFGDPRVRIVEGPRKGIAAAWNTALEASTGNIVMECDADDAFPPGRIAFQRALMESRPEFGAVCGRFSTIDSEGHLVAQLLHDRSQGEEISQELLAGVTRTSLCSFAIARAQLLALNGMRTYFECGSDIDLQIRLAERCRVWFDPNDAYRYRLHGTSITHTMGKLRREFFDSYARELRRQRAGGRRDDLDLGTPLLAPAQGEASSCAAQIQGMLLGSAWQSHQGGDRAEALKKGWRALRMKPSSLTAWKSVAALLVKPTGTPVNDR
jgi:glycosyltransferase involved in cell wall biosynthesis